MTDLLRLVGINLGAQVGGSRASVADKVAAEGGGKEGPEDDLGAASRIKNGQLTRTGLISGLDLECF